MKIAVEIDCGKKYCGSCKYQMFMSAAGEGGLIECQVFGEYTDFDEDKDNDCIRLPECIAAEIKEKV
jgi:hypothetical protein